MLFIPYNLGCKVSLIHNKNQIIMNIFIDLIRYLMFFSNFIATFAF